MINRVVLVGRMTKDSDLRFTPQGVAVATFTLAVNRPFSNQAGEKEADFINCVIWRKSAETLANHTKKGSLIGVEGRIQSRSYDGQDGKKVYVTEVVCDSFSFLESKGERTSEPGVNDMEYKENGGTGKNNDNGSGIPPGFFENAKVIDPFGGTSKTIDITDDDLPF